MQKRLKSAPPVNPNRMQKPPPGYSLTQTPGQWPWDKVPREVNPTKVVDKIIDRLERPEVEERYLRLMYAGISIEEIVHSIAMGGFMQGEFTPDVAEIIKGPLGMYFMGVAADNDIPVKVFAKDDPLDKNNPGVDDYTLLEIMRKRNPEFHAFVTSYEDPTAARQMERQEKMSSGFLGVEADMEDDELEDMAEDIFEGEDEMEGEEE